MGEVEKEGGKKEVQEENPIEKEKKQSVKVTY